MHRITTVFTISFLLAACSEANIYEGARQNQLLQCRQLPGNQYEKCVQDINENHSSYKQKRDQLLKSGSSHTNSHSH